MKNFKNFILVLMLSLSFGLSKAQTFRYSNKPKNGPIMIVGGVVLLTASILENETQGYIKTTYNTRTGQFEKTVVRPNILTNFPVNVMFGVGITLTIGGTYSWIRSVQ
jgi:hypothetical protein